MLPSSRPGSKTNFVVAKLYLHFYATVVLGCVDDRITNTSMVPVGGKASVCLICMKYRIIILIIIIKRLGEILLSYIAHTSRTHTPLPLS